MGLLPARELERRYSSKERDRSKKEGGGTRQDAS